MSILKDGTILNRNQYKITKFIAQGGFGITYLAEEIGYFKQSGFGEEYVESRNPETVVIKELYYNDYCQRDEHTGLVSISNIDKKTEFQKLVKNQIDEGKTIRSLKHPNIVRTRDIFHENETAYMVMDYIESTDLEEMLKERGHLDKETALKYIYQMLSAVDYIHTKIDKKILHLDISPSNILIDKKNDNAILIDFGSALSYDNVQNNITSTTSQIVTGRKKHYSPNEQGDIDNLKSFDATFDTYAIGATLYHLLTGEKPPLSSMVSTGREKIIPPSEFKKDPSVSEYLDAVVIKSIAPYYNERYSSAAEFESDLRKEPEYVQQLAKINQLISDKKPSEAFEQIKFTRQEFLPTTTLSQLEAELQKEIELERKTKEYNILFKKGSDMAAAEEYELAIDYFTGAKELFPEKGEADEKIKSCNEKIAQKADEKRKADEAVTAAKLAEENKGGTELLSTPAPSKPVENPMPESTELLNTPPPAPKEEKTFDDFKDIFATSQNPNKETAPAQKTAPEKKSNKNLILIGSVVGILCLAGILYASGVFSGNQNEMPITDELVTTGKDSLEIAAKEDSVKALTATQPQTDWRKEFNDRFDDVLNAEHSQSAAKSIAEYQSLLTTLPADAEAEKNKINNRIRVLNQTLAKEKESSDWSSAKKSNTQKSYQNYINKYPNGQYVSDARNRIKEIQKDTKVEPKKDENKVNDADIKQYNKDLQWAKNMISVDGCEGCKNNPTCQTQVVAKLKSALKANPGGTEAKNLLNCVQ